MTISESGKKSVAVQRIEVTAAFPEDPAIAAAVEELELVIKQKYSKVGWWAG